MKRRLRTTMVVRNDLTRDARVRREAKALAEDGHAVSVICLHSEGLAPFEEVDGYRVIRVVIPEIALPVSMIARPPGRMRVDPKSAETDAGNHRSSPRRLLGAVRGFVWKCRHECRLVRTILETRPEIVHAHDGDCVAVGILAARLTAARFIYDSHEYYSTLAPGVNGWRGKRIAWTRMRTEYQAVRTARAVVQVNPEIAAAMSRKHGLCIRSVVVRNVPHLVLPGRNGVLRRGLGIPAFIPIAIMQGQITRGTGHDTLVRAAVHLPEPWKVVILGPGPELDNAKSLAKELGLNGRVLFQGPVPHTELSSYTCDADVGVVLTQPIDESHRLALPNKLFEYMMAGLPVVGSDLPAIAAVLRKTGCGVAVDPYDPQAVADAIQKFTPGASAHAAARAAGLKAVREEYNWDREKQSLLDLYRRLGTRRAWHD